MSKPEAQLWMKRALGSEGEVQRALLGQAASLAQRWPRLGPAR